LAECPLIYDGKIICQPGGKNAVAALDIRDGKTVWKCSDVKELSGYCSPALMNINGRQQLVTNLAKHTVGLDSQTGKLIWKYKCLTTKSICPNTPLLCGQDRIYVSQGYKHGSEVFEVKGSEVKQLWFEKKCDNHFQGAAFYQGRIFSAGGGTLWCFDPEDGRAVYKVKEAKKTTFCILADGMMITYDATGGTVLLLKVNADTYEVKGSFKIDYGNDQHWSSPVVAIGKLYLRHGKGLAAFDVGK
jgi:outer membrane protein assembly factor BamB